MPLSDQEIAEYAEDAGFTGQDLETAVAVALAESGGVTNELGDEHLETEVFGPSVGLWQIRSVNPGHGGWFDQEHRVHAENLDPATNARNAFAIHERYGWDQWSAYTNGQYRQFLDRAERAVQQNRAADDDPRSGQQQPADQRSDAGGTGGTNGVQAAFADLLKAVAELLRPSSQLSNAARLAQRTAARSTAFGNVRGSSAAAGQNQRNAADHAAHAEVGRQRVDRMRDDIKTTEDQLRTFDQERERRHDLLMAPVRHIG